MKHARLSPSSSERWLSCPASVRLAEEAEPAQWDSPYAAEGTRAHTLAEIELQHEFGLIPAKAYWARRSAWESSTPEDEQHEMAHHVKTYVAEVGEVMKTTPGAVLHVEQRVRVTDDIWGTGDAIITSPSQIHVIDLKYGKGIAVSAVDNPQLKLYGVGALEEHDLIGKIEAVTLHVVQPRLGEASHWLVAPDVLRDWRDRVVLPAVEVAMSDDAPFGPSESACRFCPVSGECRAHLEWVTRRDFGDTDLLSSTELAEALEMISAIRAWCKSVEQLAQTKIYSEGVQIPGWKVVRSHARRKIEKQDEALAALTKAGYHRDQVGETKLLGITKLERVVGKKTLPQILGDLLVKGEGSPVLAKETDPRPAVTPAAEALKDFGPSDED